MFAKLQCKTIKVTKITEKNTKKNEIYLPVLVLSITIYHTKFYSWNYKENSSEANVSEWEEVRQTERESE